MIRDVWAPWLRLLLLLGGIVIGYAIAALQHASTAAYAWSPYVQHDCYVWNIAAHDWDLLRGCTQVKR